MDTLKKYTTMNKNMALELCKIFTVLLVIFAFFLPINSLWFNLVISTAIGSGYYLLGETYPQVMMIISVLVKYQNQKIKNKISKWFLWTRSLQNGSLIKSDRFSLQLEDNFNSLEYFDNRKVGCKDKKYIYLFNERLRSNDLIVFKNELGQDITDCLEPYLGPMQNFHGVPLTPADFNHKKIKLFRDGDICLSKTFEEHEVMVMG
jgi:hypothetical protein